MILTWDKSAKEVGVQTKPRKSEPAHGLYKHGKGKSRDYDPKLLSAWKEAVLRQYNFKCFISQETKNLEAHHLESWNSAPDKHYDISNGIILKREIHQEFHTNFGKGWNTRAQFEYFTKEKYSITHFPWQHGNHDPIFTVKEIFVYQALQQEKKQTEFFELLKSRQHKLICAKNGLTAKVMVIIYCEKH